MRIVYTIFFFFLLQLITASDTLRVSLDGTQQYESIMEAVNDATDGDVVLVYPSTYYGNISFNGKDITIASLYLKSGDDNYIKTTILDAQNYGSCVSIKNDEENARLCGFTIQRGRGTNPAPLFDGGGVYIRNAVADINNCVIQDNHSSSGGGMFIYGSDVNLSGNIIRNNTVILSGGGILTTHSSNVVFDSVKRNSIYFNYAPVGPEMCTTYTDSISVIYLDTCTVVDPNHYYISSLNLYSHELHNRVFDVLNGKINHIGHDLYVNPQGNNNNSGLSANEPLKTITRALNMIRSDSLMNYTIYLSHGTYSTHGTSEILPLRLKSYVPIIGSPNMQSIIDCEDTLLFADLSLGEEMIRMKNIKIQNSYGFNFIPQHTLRLTAVDIVKLDSLEFSDCNVYWATGIYTGGSDTVLISNCNIHDSQGVDDLRVFNSNTKLETYYEINSCRIYNNTNNDIDEIHEPLVIHGYKDINNPNGKIRGSIVNCEITNNVSNWAGSEPLTFGIGAGQNSYTSIINSTVAYNSTLDNVSGAIAKAGGGVVEIYNSIIFGNNPYQLSLGALTDDYYDSLFLYHNIIQDEQAGIHIMDSKDYLYYDEKTNFSADPVFLNMWDFPYQISDGSPCIDAGTLDSLPDYITLPEVDLAGNPRIVGDKIDIGSYEWNNTIVGFQKFISKENKWLYAYPNPFVFSTKINFNLKDISDGSFLNIYNSLGELVMSFDLSKQDLFTNDILWNGQDFKGNFLPSGYYNIILISNDEKVDHVVVLKL